ncbi:MAG: hypothetical protein H0W85_07410 [Methylotenera sp.]|nr:hypothetical protein [Methylotenera sp.]
MIKTLVVTVTVANIGLACSMAQAKEWVFDVYLDKSKIGQHTFTLNEANQLSSTAKFNVKILFVNAYQYDHKAVETWKGNCLATLASHTVEDKVTTDVKGKLTAENFIVDNAKNKQSLPACVMTFAYWNPKILEESKLLNPQNAEWLDTKITKVGVETIPVKNKMTEVTHYKLNGSLEGKPKLNIDLWYETTSNDWVALKSITPEGYTINYKLR